MEKVDGETKPSKSSSPSNEFAREGEQDPITVNAYTPPPLNARQKRILIKSLKQTKNMTKIEIQNLRSESTPKNMRFHYNPVHKEHHAPLFTNTSARNK